MMLGRRPTDEKARGRKHAAQARVETRRLADRLAIGLTAVQAASAVVGILGAHEEHPILRPTSRHREFVAFSNKKKRSADVLAGGNVVCGQSPVHSHQVRDRHAAEEGI